MPHNDSYQNTVRGIVERIAFELSDEEDDDLPGYDREWIKARIMDTFKWLQSRRPNLFAHNVTLPLQAGSEQSLPPDCDALLDVTSLCVDGVDTPASLSDGECLKVNRYAKLMSQCGPVHNYSVAVHPTNDQVFLIDPPVPADTTLQATCSNMSRFFKDEDTELDCDISQWLMAVTEYVKYLALARDGEGTQAFNSAQQHLNTFFDLAPIKRDSTE